MKERRLVVFDEHQIIAPRIDHLLAKIALAEHSVAGDQAPLEDQSFEQPKRALCSLVFSAPPLGTAACASVKPD